MLPPAAANRWRSIVATWPVLEDEWLLEAAWRGWRRPRTCSSGCSAVTAPTPPGAAVCCGSADPVAAWLIEHQPALGPPPGRPSPTVDDGLPGLPVPPDLLPLLTAPAEPVVNALLRGLGDGSFGLAHRGLVLVNFIARVRPDVLAALGALGGDDVPEHNAGLAHSLADLAATRHQMRQELDQ